MKYLLDLVLLIAVGVLWYFWDGERKDGKFHGDTIARLELSVERLQKESAAVKESLATTEASLKEQIELLEAKSTEFTSLEEEKAKLEDAFKKVRARVRELEGFNSRASGASAIKAELPTPVAAP